MFFWQLRADKLLDLLIGYCLAIYVGDLQTHLTRSLQPWQSSRNSGASFFNGITGKTALCKRSKSCSIDYSMSFIDRRARVSKQSKSNLYWYAIQWYLFFGRSSLGRWNHYLRKWRTEWGIGKRVKGYPPPTPLGLNDFKLWHVGIDFGFYHPVDQIDPSLGWAVNATSIHNKLTCLTRESFSTISRPQKSEIAEHQNVLTPKDQNRIERFRHINRLYGPWKLFML